ncbi:MAG: 3-dehydroquinate synthase, partial [Proteobacteria bacterium]
MQTLKVDLGERSYPIYIGEGLLDQASLLAPHIAGRKVAVVSNATVAPLYLDRLTQTLGAYSV